MKSTFCFGIVLLLGTGGLPPLSAQIGDRQDKPGVVQQSLVPKDQIPPAPVLSPAEALKTFTVAPGYRLELAASEPQVEEPVAIAFDPRGRIWVAEMRGYMPDVDGTGEDRPNGRIVCLEDRDGDGFYEHSSVFLDGLVMPRAILRVGDGLLVGAPPELAFHRDSDGDGRADEKTVVAVDYGVKVDPARPHLANPERAPNSLLWAYDNWIYSAAYTRRFRYRKGQWETGTTSFRGQWGLAQDSHGRLYHGSNSDHIRVDVIDAAYLARQGHFPSLAGGNVNAASDQRVWPVRVNPGINRGYRPEMLREGRLKEFTAAGGQAIYGGDRLPELTGNYFMPEPAANLVRRSVLRHEGGTVQSRNAYESSEFIASTDERFRPVNTATGPDGSLYVVDFYRGILQHRISLTSYLRDQILDRGLDRGLHLGRIYRVVAEKNPASTAPASLPSRREDWVGLLEHGNAWWRSEAQRVLVEAAAPDTVGAIREVADRGKTSLGRVQALWTLEGIGDGALDLDTVRAALDSGDPLVQYHGIRLAEPWLGKADSAPLAASILTLAEKGSAELRLQAVLSLGRFPPPPAMAPLAAVPAAPGSAPTTATAATAIGTSEASTASPAIAAFPASPETEALEESLADLVRRHPDQPFLLDAFLSGLMDREASLLRRLAARPDWKAGDPRADRILSSLSRGILGARRLDEVSLVVELAASSLSSPEGSNGKRAAALLAGLVPGIGSSRRPLALEAMPAAWPALSQHPATRPVVGRLLNTLVWPGKEGVTATIQAPSLTESQQAAHDLGATLYAGVCAACHQADGRGLEGLAPPLLDSEWILGPAERPVRIVLHGVRGPIRVLGKTHTGDMPPLGILPDDQIAAILTYLRRAWGHTAEPVDAAEVRRIREATAGHGDAWSPEELMLVP